MRCVQVSVGGILLHRPPHRQFLIQRCSHCFMAFVLLGERSIVTQPHLNTKRLKSLKVPVKLHVLLRTVMNFFHLNVTKKTRLLMCVRFHQHACRLCCDITSCGLTWCRPCCPPWDKPPYEHNAGYPSSESQDSYTHIHIEQIYGVNIGT